MKWCIFASMQHVAIVTVVYEYVYIDDSMISICIYRFFTS